MPYCAEGNRYCQIHNKKLINGLSRVMPKSKRPIEKVTTRSQTQYQQLMKTMGTESFLDSTDKNNNTNNFVAEKVGSINNGVELSLKKACHEEEIIQPPSSPIARSCDFAHITPHKVLNTHAAHLTSYEKKEILDYSKIYFIGKKGIKKRTPQTATIIGTDANETKVYGFDDNSGSYMPTIHDHIAYRYEVLKVVGKGTFGIVLNAYDHRTSRNVALKVIRNQSRFHNQAKEEIKILKYLLDNDIDNRFNVVHMYDNFIFRNHPCIVFEILSLNLFELSKRNEFLGFSLPLIRRFTQSILRCLFALSKFDIIHCDLKPENILLRQQNRSGIKVIDFGSSCFSTKRVHCYIQSRYYRSPEVILGGSYGPSIDMWSLGCILAELCTGRPLLDGDNEGDQLACMIELLGPPPPTFLNKCKPTKVKQFIDGAGNPVYCAKYYGEYYIPSHSISPRGKFRGTPGSRELLPDCKDAIFKDFVSRCLVWDPAERMTSVQAFEHQWLDKRYRLSE